MSWYQLLDILAVTDEEVRFFETQPPVACPNDGWPLESGPNGELHCVFDGWTWAG